MRLLEVMSSEGGAASNGRQEQEIIAEAGCSPAAVARATAALVAKEAHDGGALRLDDDTADPAGHAG
jgi:hypothetical protein